jgi:hypothetical protein
MQQFSSKQIVTAFVIIILGIGGYLLFVRDTTPPSPPVVEEETVVTEFEPTEPERTVIGTSVEGRPIEAYTYGTGDTHLLFAGGMHGGYEWNSVYLAYRFMDYLSANPDAIPDNLTVAIIPSLNPDGVFAVVGVEGRFTVDDAPDAVSSAGTGRFNANDVDLNRNFDCKWQSESQWRGSSVSAGTAPFSEPEAVALRDFVSTFKPQAVVFWHSQSSAVYASECMNGILPDTLAIMNAYAGAAGYIAVPKFDAYEVTGDAEGWLASIGIPSITVELSTHETIEWDKNIAGVKALFSHYGADTDLSR